MVRLAQTEGCLRTVIQRMHIVIRGAVQGVGFRPFVYRLASGMKLPGWVLNSPQGVFIEVEGEKQALESFLFRLQDEKPAPSFIQSLEFSLLDPVYFKGFEIRTSEKAGAKNTLILPDIATCPECLAEILDPGNRRYRYPFTNCTHCGPRFTIIESLPYDRPNTTMKALLAAAEAVRSGGIVAVKGLGGFHLVADARSAQSVDALRLRKHREEKPFALMCPSIEQVRQICSVSPLEARLLSSP
ncbi:MAG: (NiFe) hydrogenase maturation protein HypF, partial [Acidobacteria bacterium]|nr:(NiFe) hydrogenase maturation protein HypF [Acidobacteriota bacterium]